MHQSSASEAVCTKLRRAAPFVRARPWQPGESMKPTEDILADARNRGAGLPYAGAVTPQEAFALVQNDPKVKLVDVRTNAERDWIGRVAIPEGQHGAVQWS